jgi:peptidoglycan/xylan/chitin deacetylase (PgdA/CDA1 family)
VPSRRPDPRRRREQRPAPGHHARPRRRRRRGLGLWPVTFVLAATLVVLVAMLVVRDQSVDGGIDSADAEAVTLSTAADGRPTASGSGSGSAGDGTAATTDDDAAQARRDRMARRKRVAASRAAKERIAMRPSVANGLLCAPAPGRPTLVRKRAGGTSKRIALTFDDGPTKYTGPVLDILRKAEIPATFFVIGSQVGPNRELVRRIVREGHALANHTWSHANVSAGGAAANTQLMDTQYALQKAVGRAGCLMRPPGGAVGPGLVAWLRKHQKVGVLWDVDSNDYQLPSTAKMVREIVSATRAGSIILLHDGGGDRTRTVAAVPAIIKQLQAKGYEFVTVPELLKLPKAKT